MSSTIRDVLSGFPHYRFFDRYLLTIPCLLAYGLTMALPRQLEVLHVIVQKSSLLITLLLLTVFSALSQTVVTSVTGVVTDPSGAAVHRQP